MRWGIPLSKIRPLMAQLDWDLIFYGFTFKKWAVGIWLVRRRVSQRRTADMDPMSYRERAETEDS